MRYYITAKSSWPRWRISERNGPIERCAIGTCKPIEANGPLLDVMGEKAVSLSAEAATRLDTLPDSFREFAARPKISRAQARKTVEGAQTPEKPANAPAPALESVDRAA